MTPREQLFAELDQHLNNGCSHPSCRFFALGLPEFDDRFIKHLVDIVVETYENPEESE